MGCVMQGASYVRAGPKHTCTVLTWCAGSFLQAVPLTEADGICTVPHALLTDCAGCASCSLCHWVLLLSACPSTHAPY
jgi:hypothetical protein